LYKSTLIVDCFDNARSIAYGAEPLKHARAEAGVVIRPIARAALRALALFKTVVYYVVPFKHAGAKAGVIIRSIAQAALLALAHFRSLDRGLANVSSICVCSKGMCNNCE
jgi:hypothetical protein